MKLKVSTFSIFKKKLLSNLSNINNDWIYVKDFNILYLPIPKNANSFLKSLFLLNNSTSKDFNPSKETPINYINRNKDAFPLIKDTSLLNDPGIIKIILLRDPQRRLISSFLDKLIKKYPQDLSYLNEIAFFKKKDCKNITFSDFMDYLSEIPLYRLNKHFRPQDNWIKKYDGLEKFDFVGRLEEMDKVINYLKSLGLACEGNIVNKLHPGSLKKTIYKKKALDAANMTVEMLSNMTEYPSYLEYFGDHEYKIYKKIYKEDIKIYNSIK